MNLAMALSISGSQRADTSPGLSLSSSSIPENSAQGTDVATLTPTNASNPGAVSIAAQSVANLFQMNVDGVTLEVGSGFAGLNYEVRTSATVTLQYTDDNGTYQFVKTISIGDVDDGPVIVTSLSDLVNTAGNGPFVISYAGAYSGYDTVSLFSIPTGSGITIDTVAETITVPDAALIGSVAIEIEGDSQIIYDGFDIEITAANTAPSIIDNAFSATIPEGTAVAVISTHPTLATGLAEYWEFGEASGNRTGAHNSIVLTDTNTVTSTTGTAGNAALFTAANTEYLTVNDSSHGGNLDITGDLTVSCRFKFTSFPSATSVVLVTKNVGASKSWFMDLEETGGPLTLRLSVSSNGSANTVNGFDIVGSIATGTWCRLTAMYDASAGSVEFFFNTTSLGTRTGFPTSLFNSTADFRVGASNGATNPMDTAAEGLAIYSRLLTTSELSDLHNGNVLLPYAA